MPISIQPDCELLLYADATPYTKCGLKAWVRWTLPGGHTSIGTYANLCMYFQCLNTDFVGNANTMNIWLILSTITVLFVVVLIWTPVHCFDLLTMSYLHTWAKHNSLSFV